MQTETSDFIRTYHLSKEVQSGDSQISILCDINLTVKKGETLAILGTSGSGKTTLLTLLAGLDLPTGGDVYIKQHHLNLMNEEERALLRGKEIGFIFQSFQLLPNLTALENVFLPLEIQYVPHREAREKAEFWLNKVGLTHRKHFYPLQLSGGEQQRVAIARAFVTNPTVIFADEMTGNLDSHTGERIADELFQLNQDQNTTLILVTHDVHLAQRCQHRFKLEEGRLTPC